jgi:hypothetical protein
MRAYCLTAAVAASLALVLTAVNASASTLVTVYRPAAMRVTATIRGNCWTDSIATARADAFRCMAGNRIYDPCFARGVRQVACPTDLARNSGVVIVSNLPKNPPPYSQPVWAMRLSNGVVCTAITGTTMPGYPFGCTNSLDCSAPRLSARQSVVRCADENAHPRGIFGVATIWR